VAATSSGVNVEAYRRNVFALSAAYAGLAGGLYALFIGFISPASFTVNLSIQFVIFAVVGGLSTVLGPVIGTVLVMLLLQVLNVVGTMPGMPAELPTILNYAVYAVLLLATMLLLPGGVYAAIRDLLHRLLNRDHTATAAATN
jgi:branched-chain amino acid transport system permease protein